MVTSATKQVLAIIVSFSGTEGLERWAQRMAALLTQHAAGQKRGNSNHSVKNEYCFAAIRRADPLPFFAECFLKPYDSSGLLWARMLLVALDSSVWKTKN